ncbi:hypothetical protein SERLA73DRAFT_130244, partial [Serpula lacrymans var. lacrymans S7.3]
KENCRKGAHGLPDSLPTIHMGRDRYEVHYNHKVKITTSQIEIMEAVDSKGWGICAQDIRSMDWIDM